jgi:glutamate/aspartate transport system substrate-binding protein
MMRALAAAAALVVCLASSARAQNDGLLTGTLKTLSTRGTILIGVRPDAAPFSFANKAGQPVGFSVDLCRGIAADAAAALNLDLLEPDAPSWQTGLRMKFVPITADSRLPSIVSGAIDLECGSTTANAERSKTVAFSPVFFLAGTKLLAAPSVVSYRNLAGRKIGVGAGTTNEAVLQRLSGSVSPPFTIVRAPGVDAAYDLLAGGQVDAIASDDILLSGLAATHPDGKKFAIIGDFLSFEPYAIVLRRDDPDFAALVRASFQRMAADGTLTGRYNSWFTDRLPSGETLALPMSAQLTEMYRALGQPD